MAPNEDASAVAQAPASASSFGALGSSPRHPSASAFGGAMLLQELHDATHFSLAELGALRERFAANGARACASARHTQAH
jgi:hypothetical protein